MRYGQRPEAVKRWDLNEFDEAFIVWQGEAPYELTGEEIEEDLRSQPARPQLLDRDRNYWMRFVVDGELDEASVLARNYRPGQVPFIKDEMRRLGWLPN